MRIERVILAGLVASLAGVPRLAAQERVSLASAPAADCTPRPILYPRSMTVRGTTLSMAPATYSVGDSSYTTNVYNGNFLGPTLRMEPGQTVTLSVLNRMRETPRQPASVSAWTNLHYHGLVVTPRPDGGDNVTHVHIDRDAPRRRYDFPVPPYHTQGMFWYHPHPHGISTSQVAGGLSGALLVGSILDRFPQYLGVRERVLLIRDMSFSFSNPTVLNINGSTCARLSVPPGEQELWHIGNFGSNTFVNLKLEGMQWTLLGMDGNPTADTTMVDSLYIPPGSRAEVIVTGPPRGTRVRLYSAPFLPGVLRDTSSVTLGYLVGEGFARPPRAVRRVAGVDASVIDTLRFLRGAREVQTRTFHFDFVGNDAGIDSVVYKPTDLPVAIPWRHVQEWTLINRTRSLHTFHIHQTDFTIISLNGVAVDDSLLRDNVPVGVHRVFSSPADTVGTIVGDTVVVRFTFEPIAAGPFVFHCHVLQHEDEGMMKNVCVYDPNDPGGVNKCNALFSGGGGGHGGH